MDEEAFDGMDLFELLDAVDYWEPARAEERAGSTGIGAGIVTAAAQESK